MILRIFSIVLHLILTTLVLLYAPTWLVWIWVAVEFLNGRHWFAESSTLFDYLTMGYINPLSILIWASGEWPNWVAMYVIGFYFLITGSDLALPTIAMGLAHMIGSVWVNFILRKNL